MKQIALSLFVIASSGAYVLDQRGNGSAGDIIDTAGLADSAESNVLHPAGPGPATATAVPPVWSAPANKQQGARIEPQATRPTPFGTEPKAAIAKPIPATSLSRIAEVYTLAVSNPRVSEPPIPQPKLTTPQFVDDAPLQAASFAITPAVYIPVPQPRPNYPQAPAIVIKAGTKPAGHSFSDGTYTGPVTDAYYGLFQIQASIQGGRLTSLKVLRYPNDRRTSISINRQALPMLRDEAISAQSANVDIISGATLTSRAFRQSLAGALKQASS